MKNKNDNDDELDDETWIKIRKEFWEKNNITPLKIKDGSITPAELEKLLKEKFGTKK